MLKEKDALINIEKHKKIKTYRNKITDLLKTSKHAHYHKYFEENKKNWKALWIRINEIVYSKNKNETNSPLPLIQDGKTIADQKHCWTFQQFLHRYWQKITKKETQSFADVIQNSRHRCSAKKGVLKKFRKFHRKIPVLELLDRPAKKRLQHRCFPVNLRNF